MHSNVVRGVLKPWANAARTQLNLTPDIHGRATRFGGKMTCCTREPAISSKLHLIHLWNISFKRPDWSLTNFSSRFPRKFHNSPALILTEMLIWNEKGSVKYGDIPDQSQSFRTFARSSHCCKLRKAPKQTTSSLDRFGHELIPELFIRTVRVLCKSYSYKWFLSHLM